MNYQGLRLSRKESGSVQYAVACNCSAESAKHSCRRGIRTNLAGILSESIAVINSDKWPFMMNQVMHELYVLYNWHKVVFSATLQIMVPTQWNIIIA